MQTINEIEAYVSLAKFEHNAIGELFISNSNITLYTMNNGVIDHISKKQTKGYSIREIFDNGKVKFYASNLPINTNNTKKISGFTFRTDYYPQYVNFNDELCQNLLHEIHTFISQYDFVKNVILSITSTEDDVWIIRENHQIINDKRPMFRLVGTIVIEKNNINDTVYFTCSQRNDFSVLSNIWKEEAINALERAKVLLTAKPFKGGEMQVLLSNGVNGVLLHECIGHGLEADFHNSRTSIFVDKLGQSISHNEVTIVDDGTLPHKRGSLHFDDEGTPTQKTYLTRNGILTNLMTDRLNARALNLPETGNGRRESYAHPIFPRMRNTYMENGTSTQDEMISSVKSGVFVKHLGGGQVNITSGEFTFDVSEIYLIENGKITTPLRGCTIAGSGLKVLEDIIAVGNDMELDSCGGSCGKNRQLVPVGIGQPSILVKSLNVGSYE